jgi:hypothetical protein
VEIAPRYRGYDYFVAEEEIVIVEPGTSRIVTTLSRNGQFAHGGPGGQFAQGGQGGGSGASVGGRQGAGGGNVQTSSLGQGGAGGLCRIEDAGRGGSGGNSGLAVAVRSQDGRATDMISLPAGRITVEVDPSGGCTITVER